MFSADLIISEPEILSIELNSMDEFLVVATDGVWDVLTPEQAIKKTR
jgi:serine/threonine protein phosphatase PrpC